MAFTKKKKIVSFFLIGLCAYFFASSLLIRSTDSDFIYQKEKTVFNLGLIKWNEKKEFSVVFSKKELNGYFIENCLSTCDCLELNVQESGADSFSGLIKGTLLSTKMWKGSFYKTFFVTLESADLNRKMDLELAVKGQIVGGPSQREYIYGDIKDGLNDTKDTLSFDSGLVVKIPVTFYTTLSCASCQQVISYLKSFSNYISLDIRNLELIEHYKEMLKVEEEYGLHISSNILVIVKGVVLQGKESVLEHFEEVLHGKKQSDPVAEKRAFGEARGAKTDSDLHDILSKRLKEMSPSVIVAAGLADGVNPCVFSTIIFLVTFMLSFKKRRKDILLIGGFFTLSSFVTYFLLGVGLLTVLRQLVFFEVLFVFLKLALAVIALLVGLLHIIEVAHYLVDRDQKKIVLRLPVKVKKKIIGYVNKYLRSKHLIFGAVVLGVIVTVFESVCTGQLYLPTIYLIIKEGLGGTRPYMYLMLYNFMFILPLVLVFLLCLWVVDVRKFLGLEIKGFVFGKLFLGVLFLCMGVLLLFIN